MASTLFKAAFHDFFDQSQSVGDGGGRDVQFERSSKKSDLENVARTRTSHILRER